MDQHEQSTSLAARVVPAPKPNEGEPKSATVVKATALTPATEVFAALGADGYLPPDELLLVRLVAEEAALIERLQQVERKLAAQLDRTLDSPRLALSVARVLRELVRVDCAVSRRVTEVLRVGSELRARRTLLERGAHVHGV